MNMKEHTITIDVETNGLDETREQIEGITDALANIPPQVVIRNCRHCEINIHPQQKVILNNSEFNMEGK